MYFVVDLWIQPACGALAVSLQTPSCDRICAVSCSETVVCRRQKICLHHFDAGVCRRCTKTAPSPSVSVTLSGTCPKLSTAQQENSQSFQLVFVNKTSLSYLVRLNCFHEQDCGCLLLCDLVIDCPGNTPPFTQWQLWWSQENPCEPEQKEDILGSISR